MKKLFFSTMVLGILSISIGMAQSLRSDMIRKKTDISQLKRADRSIKTPSLPEKFYPFGKNIKAAPMVEANELGDDDALAYGCMVYDNSYWTRGLISWTTNNINSLQMIKDFGSGVGDGNYALCAGTMIGDDYWGYLYIPYDFGYFVPVGLGILDLKTGEFENKFNYEQLDFLFSDMTYDPSTKTIYTKDGGATDENGNFLYVTIYKISLEDEEALPVPVGQVDTHLFTLAADNGKLYGIAADGVLYQINLGETIEDCSVTSIGNTGKTLNYAQTMEFDHTTHRLWWAGQAGDDSAWFCEVNPQNGSLLHEQTPANNAEIVAMGIPYQIVPDEAPSYVRNLKYTVGENGEQTATFTWTNPTVNYQLEPLSSLTGIKIFRDGQPMPSLGNNQTTWTDADVSSGIHTYKFQTYNDAGDGLYKEKTLFIGRDAPGKVQNLTLTADGTVGTLSWEAPVTGKNGGWFDTQTLKYRIVRITDNKEVVTDLQTNTFEDTVDKVAGYTYSVTAYNADGEGEAVITNIVPFGPVLDLPFFSALDTEEDFNKCLKIDANEDGVTWTFSGTEAIYMFCMNPADDYLVTPAFNMKAANEYQVRYEYKSVQATGFIEKMKVYVGEKGTVESFSTPIADHPSIDDGSIWNRGIATFNVPKDHSYVMGFQCCSDANQFSLMLRNICIRQYSDTDLSAVELSGSESVNATKPTTYRLRVANEGRKTVNQYMVQLINTADNSVLAETAGVAVEKGDTVTTEITWIPEAEGAVTLAGKVVLTEDTYPDDNITVQPIKVTIQSKDAPLWITIGKKENRSYINPLYYSFKYNTTQTLYYKEEINLDKATLNGIEYHYDESNADMPDMSVKIYMQNTSTNKLADEETPSFLELQNFTLVYEGTFSCKKQEGDKVTCIFTTPFEYTGNNLCVMVESVRNDDAPDGGLYWSVFQDANHPNRASGYRKNDAPYEKGMKTKKLDWIPYTALAYTVPVPPDAIRETNANYSFKVIPNNGILHLSKYCEAVYLTDITGMQIYAGNNITSIPVNNLPAGIYILNAQCDGKNITVKVAIK